MKIGVCCGINLAKDVQNLGYDYIEEHMTNIMSLTDADFSELVKQYQEISIPVYSTNCFYPGDYEIYNDETFGEVQTYIETALYRAHALGVKVCVFGSGYVRRVREESMRPIIEEKFCKITSLMGNTAKQYGIKIAIEALSYRETNLANKVSEAVGFANRINLNNVGVLVDFFQYALNKEDDDGLVCAKGKLFHAHLARPNLDRRMPTEEDIPHIKKWNRMLRDIGYDQCISLEGAFDLKSLQQTKKIVDLFR